ncbi:MAG: Phage integrase [Gammaproteobacteria bacterium]|jgi:integrase|nr:Phage integrase [Gammaproteobacteria bacterium]
MSKELSNPSALSNPGNTTEMQALTTHLYLQAATSPNTRRAYQSDVRHFINGGGLLPTTPTLLLHYLQSYAQSLNPRTLKRRLVAIRQWHTSQGFPDPTAHPLVRKTLTGILHVHGKPPKKSPPLPVEQLMLMDHYLRARNGTIAWRNNALLQIGFFGAFRRSELVAIQWEQVSFVVEGVEISVPRSKTDQEGHGQICAIPYGNSQLCPVTTLHRWRELANHTTGAVFRHITKSNCITTRPLSPQYVSDIIKNVAMACQLPNAKHYSGHSLRHGFATAATKKGASFGAIMRQGRWRHEGTVRGYIEEGQRFDTNAANSILEALNSSVSPD